jgi:hypothetical protein
VYGAPLYGTLASGQSYICLDTVASARVGAWPVNWTTFALIESNIVYPVSLDFDGFSPGTSLYPCNSSQQTVDVTLLGGGSVEAWWTFVVPGFSNRPDATLFYGSDQGSASAYINPLIPGLCGGGDAEPGLCTETCQSDADCPGPTPACFSAAGQGNVCTGCQGDSSNCRPGEVCTGDTCSQFGHADICTGNATIGRTCTIRLP